jgi:muramoyltetrapeptide carboxypeptidase
MGRMTATWPRLLPAGGTIGICSPAGPSPLSTLKNGISALEAHGYKVVVGENAQGLHPKYLYLAGTDAERVSDLNSFLSDPSIDLILCARGGYGCARLLDKIDWDAARKDPKPLVGYSDITALHLGLASQAGVVGFSGIMATAGDGFGERSRDKESESWFFQAVTAGDFPRTFTRSEHDTPWKTIRPPREGDTITGPIFPICLTLLETLMGTPYVPDLTGAILLIEDIGEELYAIDRMLTQLRLAGILDKLAGILVGSFNGLGDGREEEDAHLSVAVPQLCLEMTPSHVPVIAGVAYGHIPRRFTLPVGAVGTIDTATNAFTFNNK